MSHRGIGIIEGITSLQRKDCVKSRCSSTEGFFELIQNSNGKEVDANVNWKNSNPNFGYQGNCLMEGTYNKIETFSVSKILRDRSPSTECSSSNKYFTVLQSKFIAEKEADGTKYCAEIPTH